MFPEEVSIGVFEESEEYALNHTGVRLDINGTLFLSWCPFLLPKIPIPSVKYQ
jgi:hypothetical protein